MKYENLELQEGLEKGLKMPYAFISSLSFVSLGYTPENIDLSELIEARFFNDKEEIRIYSNEEILNAVYLKEEAEDKNISKVYVLKDNSFGNEITVKYDLDIDEDGQTYIHSTRLSDWKGGK